MTDRSQLEDLERRLLLAENELKSWQRAKGGASNAAMASKLVHALQKQIAEIRSGPEERDQR